MRIAVAGIEHETNTYAVDSFGTTPLKAFRQRRGDEILAMAGTRTYVGGMLDAIDRLGFEAVPTLFAVAGPSGTIEADAYAALRSEIVERLTELKSAADGGFDAVALDLHGAGVVEGIEDLEADLAAAVRRVVGPDTPVVATLDLHGNITPAMAEELDLMLGVHEYPHVDMFDRGVEAIESLPALIEGRWSPTTWVEQLPLLLPTSTTDMAPASDIRDACLAAEADDGVIDATFFHGFPYTDVAFTGASIVVTTNDDLGLARDVARALATQLWERRSEFRQEALTPEIAVRQATDLRTERGSTSGPVVINETSDNPGGGSPGDATHVLRAMVEAQEAGIDLGRACYGAIFDKATAAQAAEAGAGATIRVSLGGHHDDLHGAPIEALAHVKCVTDGIFTYTSPMLAGVVDNWGPLVRLQLGGQVGGKGSIDVLVASRRSQVFDHQVFVLCGIDVPTYDLVVLKSSQHFRAGFAGLASEILTADSPGLTTLAVEVFAHPAADGPRWPHDPATQWSPAAGTP